jgi:protein-disulfide isomerase
MGEHKLKKNRSSIIPFAFTKSSFSALLIIVFVLGILGLDLYLRQRRSPMNYFDPARTKGAENARLKIVEFADFQCHECSRGHALLKTYLEKYPQDIRLTMKYFPLGKLNSTVSAVHASCAAKQNKFWDYIDVLFSQQSQWQNLMDVRPYFLSLARRFELNEEAFTACVQDVSVASSVQAEKFVGESNAVRSTPTYFINKEMVVGVQSLQKYLEKTFGTNHGS